MKKRRLTPRKRQMIFRKILLGLSLVFAGAVLALIVSGMFGKAKAADNYKKYYKYIEVESGDTLYAYSLTYGEHFKNSDEFIKEVCIINNINPDEIVSGDTIVVPYYECKAN